MKKILLFVLLFVLVLPLAGCSALPETQSVLVEVQGLFWPALDDFLAAIVVPLLILFPLVILNLIIAVLAAIKQGTFDLAKLANYLSKDILWNIGGWLFAMFLSVFIAAYIELLWFELPYWVDDVVMLVFSTSLFMSLLSRILKNGMTAFDLWETAFGELYSKIAPQPIEGQLIEISGELESTVVEQIEN